MERIERLAEELELPVSMGLAADFCSAFPEEIDARIHEQVAEQIRRPDERVGRDLVAVYVGGELLADFVGGQAELVEGVAVSSEAAWGFSSIPTGQGRPIPR